MGRRRDRLECSHCHALFLGTEVQTKHKRAGENQRSYCSRICQDAGEGQRRRRPFPYNGTCPQCSKQFGSRYPKKFCSMNCYIKSTQFQEMIRKNAGIALNSRILKLTGEPPRASVEYTCLNCGHKWIDKASAKRRYCSKLCYRQYLSQRFDRWMASPQQIALPQSFDEFMAQDELPCLVEGCDWVGLALGNHVNFAHGITAEEFKRAVGFNLSTGLVTPELSDKLGEWPRGGHLSPGTQFKPGHHEPLVTGYVSLESREHSIKTRALLQGSVELPAKICFQCGKEYRKMWGAFSAKFCSLACRNEWYRAQAKARVYPMKCCVCSVEFMGNRAQYLRTSRGQDVACSLICRNRRNIPCAIKASIQSRRARAKTR